MFTRVQSIFQWSGAPGIAFLLLLAGYTALGWIAPDSGIELITGFLLLVAGIWLMIRVLRLAAAKAVWRLRDRLLVTYLFISVVPILLVIALAVGSSMLLARQLVVYLVASELDRRVEGFRSFSSDIARTDPEEREVFIRQIVDLYFNHRYPGIAVLVRQAGQSIHYPESSLPPAPPDGWQSVSGVMVRNGSYFLWSYAKIDGGDITLTAPLTSEYLASFVPGLGLVDYVAPGAQPVGYAGVAIASRLPPVLARLDAEFQWFASEPTWQWDHPQKSVGGVLRVRSRGSAVLATLFNRRSDLVQGFLVSTMMVGIAVFLIVELITVLIGVTMTRTITGAVQRLYEGTKRIRAGDFSHRIEVIGRDQLAELSQSFNQMTENMQRLLVVAQEKERLQSEIEIAREVQNQLYPRAVPKSRTLRLMGFCQPARTVSGDYYDYENVQETQIALAIGDVAGKGISAALLMATLQSSLRAQLQNCVEQAGPAGSGSVATMVSTSHIVSRLNSQLYSYTSAEKYATFCLGIYDEPASVFTYTNAGHLPPILIRQGAAERLDVNGTVVGAFPFSVYDESSVDLRSGDLLVFFSDGVTEPENAYGEMFGEDRLIDVITRNAHLSEGQIVELVLASVRDWTASEELQDDITIMLARRI